MSTSKPENVKKLQAFLRTNKIGWKAAVTPISKLPLTTVRRMCGALPEPGGETLQQRQIRAANAILAPPMPGPAGQGLAQRVGRQLCRSGEESGKLRFLRSVWDRRYGGVRDSNCTKCADRERIYWRMRRSFRGAFILLLRGIPEPDLRQRLVDFRSPEQLPTGRGIVRFKLPILG
jgi:hypothetical protein